MTGPELIAEIHRALDELERVMAQREDTAPLQGVLDRVRKLSTPAAQDTAINASQGTLGVVKS